MTRDEWKDFIKWMQSEDCREQRRAAWKEYGLPQSFWEDVGRLKREQANS